MATERHTDTRLASAWYIKYHGNAYAHGPLRYKEAVQATIAVAEAEKLFGEPPHEVWPTGPTQETEEYEFFLQPQD